MALCGCFVRDTSPGRRPHDWLKQLWDVGAGVGRYGLTFGRLPDRNARRPVAVAGRVRDGRELVWLVRLGLATGG